MSVSVQQDQINRWQRNGHEPVWERGTVRLREFKKSFPRGLEVTVLDKATGKYVPFMLRCGRPLLCSEVLPERADLALDEDGHLLSQADFEQNYQHYLAAYTYPSGSDLAFEPVPNVVNYVKEMPDPWSESNGMIEIGTPKDTGEFRPGKRFGPNGETEEEWLAESAKNSADVASALNKMTALQEQLTAFLMKQAGAVSTPSVSDAPVGGLDAEAAAVAVGESTEETAPCGKRIRKGYLAQHQRFCNSDDCGGIGENSAEDGS